MLVPVTTRNITVLFSIPLSLFPIIILNTPLSAWLTGQAKVEVRIATLAFIKEEFSFSCSFTTVCSARFLNSNAQIQHANVGFMCTLMGRGGLCFFSFQAIAVIVFIHHELFLVPTNEEFIEPSRSCLEGILVGDEFTCICELRQETT